MLPSDPKRSKSKSRSKTKQKGASHYGILFVTFLFVCITMVSFAFHEGDGGVGEGSISMKLRGEEERGGGASTNPYTATNRGKLLRPSDSHYSYSDTSASVSTSLLKAAEIATSISESESTSTGDTSSTSSSTSALSKMSQEQLHSLWTGRMFQALEEQPLLFSNALSKIHQWKNVAVDSSLHEEGRRKRVLFYMGWCAYFDMEALALRGGPAGEFVIWADLVTGMAALGFELVFVKTICNFWKLMKTQDSSKFDVVITDYDGIGTAENAGQFPLYHCKYYLVDGFGTQAPFNRRHFDLKKILTPYPFDNSNTPIHLITGVLPKPLWAKKREDYGILWAKLPKYLFPSHDHRLLEVVQNISKMVTLHTSLPPLTTTYLQGKFGVGDGIIPAPGQRNRTEYLRLMTGAKFLLGIGLPLDGPTALEAIAHGCPFINPIFNPPRQQSKKPTRFNYTSQHPFIEANFGPPHVYTIDIFDPEVVERTIRTILTSPPPEPLVHPSNAPEEYLANLRTIFFDTPCNLDAVPAPSRHPGNRAFSSYTSYVNNECRVHPCPSSSHQPYACAMEMYNRTAAHEDQISRGNRNRNSRSEGQADTGAEEKTKRQTLQSEVRRQEIARNNEILARRRSRKEGGITGLREK